MPYKYPHSKIALASRNRRARKYQKSLHGGFFYRYYRMKNRSKKFPSNKDYIFYKDFNSSWKSFNDFKHDMWISFLEHMKVYGIKNTTLERINNLKGYSKSNCRWATRKEQALNRRKKYTVSIIH